MQSEVTATRYIVNREIELSATGASLDKRGMTLGQRIEDRRKQIGISQAELARRVGIRQSTVNSLIRGDSRSSRSIVQIARELHTTPAYLTGSTDDPDEGAQPTPEPRIQLVSLPVALPSVPALAAAFRGLLMASRDMGEEELARELAKRLPTVLRIAGDALPSAASDDDDDELELAEAPVGAEPARRRA